MRTWKISSPQTLQAADFNIERRTWNHLRRRNDGIKEEVRTFLIHVMFGEGVNAPFLKIIEGQKENKPQGGRNIHNKK